MREITSHLVLNDSSSAALNEVINPSSGEVFAKVAYTSQADIEHKLSTADALFKDRSRWLPLDERVAILERLASIMTERQDELARDIASEGGKPLQDALVEAARAVQGVKKCIEVISTEQGEVIPMGAFPATRGRLAFTQKEPMGLVLAVSAFNHPLNLIVHQVGAAFAAGCPCLVKPAGDTPISCINFFNMIKEAGAPDGWVSVVVPEYIAQAEALVSDARIGFFSFIGSGKVGWALRRKLAEGTRCALEHGGIAPVFVTRSAELDKTIPSILKGGFYHAGQVCVSTQRIYVDESIAAEFSHRLAEGAEQLIVGDAIDIETQVGPLIRPTETDRVSAWVEDALSAGTQCLTGGEKLDENFYRPTVLLNPPDNAKVSQFEIFGPVVNIYPYAELSDAIKRANDVPFSFQGAVFSQHMPDIMRVYKGMNASAVMVNDHSAFREDGMPFAGLKSSGLGVGGIKHSIHDMQIDKMLVLNEVLPS